MNAYKLSVLCLLLSSIGLQASPLTAPVQEIRLYRSGGEALRIVQLDGLSRGQELVIGKLPSSTEMDGFQVRVLEGDGVRLGNVRFERLNSADLPKSEARISKEAELLSIQRSLKALTKRIEAAAARVQVYADLRGALIRGIEESPETDFSERIWEAFTGEQAAAEARRELEYELSEQIDQFEDSRKRVERELQEIRQSEQALNGQLTIDILGSTDGPVTIELKSRFQNAGWEPLYRVNANPEAELVSLDYQARLHNRSGEPWSEVKVTLLTGRPGWRMEAPVLPPVFLRKPQPSPPYAARQATEKVFELSAFSVAADAEMPTVERLTTQFTLQLPVPVHMEGFENGKLVDLERTELAATFWSAITPAVQEAAFLHGKTTVDLEWPLLPGPVSLLVDGAFVGKTQFGLVNPGDELELGFGENPAILVEYKVLDVMARNTGVFEKVRRYKRHYETTVTNRMPVAHTVHVNSRFPISRDEEISVDRISPEGVEVEAESGRFHWEQRMIPGSEEVFATEFEVTAPRDWELPEVF